MRQQYQGPHMLGKMGSEVRTPAGDWPIFELLMYFMYQLTLKLSFNLACSCTPRWCCQSSEGDARTCVVQAASPNWRWLPTPEFQSQKHYHIHVDKFLSCVSFACGHHSVLRMWALGWNEQRCEGHKMKFLLARRRVPSLTCHLRCAGASQSTKIPSANIRESTRQGAGRTRHLVLTANAVPSQKTH